MAIQSPGPSAEYSNSENYVFTTTTDSGKANEGIRFIFLGLNNQHNLKIILIINIGTQWRLANPNLQKTVESFVIRTKLKYCAFTFGNV